MCDKNTLLITATEIVEVVVDDITKLEFTFPQNLSTIEKGRIVAIAAYNATTASLSPNNKAVVNNTVFSKAYLILRDSEKGRDDINKFPLIDLVRSANNGQFVMLDGSKFDFSQSKIVIPSAVGLALNEVFMFQVIYIPDSKVCKK